MIAVIISYWSGRSTRSLYKLLNQIYRYDARAPFSVTVVCNGGDKSPLSLPKKYVDRGVKVLNRINSGYNIGAWEYGWRNDQGSEYFLFLQDECRILKAGWLKAFVEKMQASPEIGLLGESINWKRSWDEQRNNPLAAGCLNREGEPPFNSVDFLREFLVRENIPPGETAEHLQSLVLFSSRKVLETISGFPTCDIYAEAVGTEIAISKKVLAHGYQIAEVGDKPFSYIVHPQWVMGWYKRWIKLKLFLRPYKAQMERWIAKKTFGRVYGKSLDGE